MSYPPSPSHYPNLPAGQRLTQWLVDQFNGDERRWRELRERLEDIAKRLKRGRICGKTKGHERETRHAGR